jgi:rhodanese-related sulfurtransferase
VDVRPKSEYDAGHIRRAISIPVDELETRLDEIPDGADIVACCRGPFCVYVDDAVRLLTRRGRPAARLEDGFPEWAADRLAVDSRTD